MSIRVERPMDCAGEPQGHSPVAKVHLTAIQANWQALNRLFPKSETSAVVKADAYGLGAPQVAKALAATGCKSFFTAYADEGATVHEALGGAAEFYVLNGIGSNSCVHFTRTRLSPVLNSVDEIGRWCAEGPPGPFALMVDTGMNRLGVAPEEIGDALATMGDARPVLVMSHLACADNTGHPANRRQLETFRSVAAHFPGCRLSLANSAGHALGMDYGFDLTRPGLALYGGGPAPQGLSWQPALSLYATILKVFDVTPGETVGYGATYTTERLTTIATVSIGYGDGLPRSASNKGFVVLGDTRCPIVGRVSMDLITIDVTAARGLAKPGAVVEVLGSKAKLDEQAAAAGTLGYELLTGLGHRVHRQYEL